MYQSAQQLLLSARDGVVRIKATTVLGLSLNVRVATTTNVRRGWQATVASFGRPDRAACAASWGGRPVMGVVEAAHGGGRALQPWHGHAGSGA